MELIDYLQPMWVNALITLGVCLTGGAFVCVMFALGIKHGLDDFNKKRGKKE